MTKSLQPGKKGALEVSGNGPVRLRITPITASTATLELGVDYARADVPRSHYDADYCDVVEARTGVALVFGKLKPENKELRTKLEITFPRRQFSVQLWNSSRKLYERLASNPRLVLPPVGTLPDPDKVQCLRSNNVFMAMLLDEAVLDFYYISPGDIHLVHKQGKASVELEPVVRIGVSSSLLREFLEKCRPLGEKLAAETETESDDE